MCVWWFVGVGCDAGLGPISLWALGLVRISLGCYEHTGMGSP